MGSLSFFIGKTTAGYCMQLFTWPLTKEVRTWGIVKKQELQACHTFLPVLSYKSKQRMKVETGGEASES